MAVENDKGIGIRGRVAVSLAGAIVGAPASYIIQRMLGAWGVLDHLSDALGRWLKIHVPPEAAGWTVALIPVLAIYGLLLWKVWRPRHIHHLPVLHETKPVASLQMKLSHATPPPEPHAPSGRHDVRVSQAQPKARPSRQIRTEQLRAAAQAIDDSQKEEEATALRRLSAVLPRNKQPDVLGGKYRNVSLAEALGWAVYGEWGRPYHVSGMGIYVGVGTDPEKLLARFTRLAREGKLTIWGKRDDPGYFEKIPRAHWKDNQLTIADIFGSIVASGEDPYRDLMLNRAEVGNEWPHDG